MLKASVNGIELSYERLGRGAPLVLLHGYPLDHSIWNPVLHLLENDFDLIMPDLRGFGGSSTSPSPFLLKDMAADIAALLDIFNIQKVRIAGHSMGGYVALAFVKTFPRRVLGLGLIASQVLADTLEKKAGRNLEAEYILSHGVGEVAEAMSLKLTADPGLQSGLKKLIQKQNPEGLAGALRAMADRPDSSDILPTLDFPVAILHGLEDKLIPIERAREARAGVKNCTLMEIKGVGHMPMMESPQATADALKTLS